MALVRRYWLASVILVIGAAITIYVGYRGASTLGVIWSGATVGILTGIAIGAANRNEEAAPRRKE